MSMTREEIEKMTDAKIAAYLGRKVMGYEDRSHKSLGPRDAAYTLDERMINWDPTNNLNQAIEAAEKVGLEQEGLSFGLVWNSASRKWMAGWGAVAGWVSHETPALAVCRAVIAAWEART